MSPPLWISGLHNISQLTVRDLQPVPQEDLPILAPDHVRVDIPDEIDDGGLEIEPAIYDTDDTDDDEEDVQKVVNDNDSEGNDLNWEDIDSFDDGIVFDDDDFEDEETAVERMERDLRGDEIKEKADLMARQLLRIVEDPVNSRNVLRQYMKDKFKLSQGTLRATYDECPKSTF